MDWIAIAKTPRPDSPAMESTRTCENVRRFVRVQDGEVQIAKVPA